MAELFYREDRDRDFFEACEQVRSEEKNLSVSEIVSKAILHPAKSFYLHKREYSSIIRKKGIPPPKSEAKRQLHQEILKRYQEIKENNPKMDIPEITKIIECQKAPRFYISKRRAEDLYYELLRK